MSDSAGRSGPGRRGRADSWVRILGSARRRRSRPAPPGSLARLTETLAVLLEAGVAPAAAWRHLAAVTEPAADAARAAAVGEALARGEPGAPVIGRPTGRAPSSGAPSMSGAVPAEEWRQLAAAWQVAQQAGAPLGPCLRAFADACRATTQARRDARVALSGPATTARLVLALPLVGLAFGTLLGLDTIGVVVTTPIGWFCVASATGLVALARFWNDRLVAAASPEGAVPGLELEILATAIGGGGSWSAARRETAAALDEHCPEALGRQPDSASVIDRLVVLSEAAGCPAATLLRSAADESRRDAAEAMRVAAERLGVRLMLPLGLCVLPAFVLVGVVPLGAALLSSTTEVF